MQLSKLGNLLHRGMGGLYLLHMDRNVHRCSLFIVMMQHLQMPVFRSCKIRYYKNMNLSKLLQDQSSRQVYPIISPQALENQEFNKEFKSNNIWASFWRNGRLWPFRLGKQMDRDMEIIFPRPMGPNAEKSFLFKPTLLDIHASNFQLQILFLSIYSFFKLHFAICSFIKYQMNSIIKQITYDEFSPLIGGQKINKFIQGSQIAILCFIADWSVPSRTTIKKIKKKNIHKQKVGIIDVDLVDSIDLCEQYQIKAVPHFILFKNKQIVSQFSGCRLQILDQMFSKLQIGQKDKQQTQSKKCLKGHDLIIRSTLPSPPYINNLFYCNICKKIQQCMQKFQVSHCQECDYDVCFSCQ